jgi:hypothetical protein
VSRIAVDSIGLDIYPAIDWAEWRLIRLGVEAERRSSKTAIEEEFGGELG